MKKTNKVVLIGRLTKDAELRFAPGTGNAVANFTLAVDKFNKHTGQKEADFIPCVVWGKQAESLSNYCSKGSQISIVGRIQTRSYDAQDGTKRYTTDVAVERFEFIGGKKQYSQNTPFDGGWGTGWDDIRR